MAAQLARSGAGDGPRVRENVIVRRGMASCAARVRMRGEVDWLGHCTEGMQGEFDGQRLLQGYGTSPEERARF